MFTIERSYQITSHVLICGYFNDKNDYVRQFVLIKENVND